MKKPVTIVAVIFACAVIALIGLPVLADLIYKPVTPINAAIPLPRSTLAPKPTPYWKTETWQIEQRAVALAPGQTWAHPLWINPEWRNARLVGRFTAQGGSGNDVYACVTNGDGLTNLRNGHPAKVWYESGRVTVDTINQTLPDGHTYFVLSNKFSIFANKAVTLDLKIEYERLVYP